MKSSFKVIYGILSGLVLWAFAITFFGLATWLLIADKTASAATSAGFGTIILFLANLDRIESFKGFGLEAKTRDLRNAISEADSAMERLEEIRADVTSLSEVVDTMHSHLDETKTMAKRARAMAAMNQ
jgi:Tfp pilus assembly protein PilO